MRHKIQQLNIIDAAITACFVWFQTGPANRKHSHRATGEGWAPYLFRCVSGRLARNWIPFDWAKPLFGFLSCSANQPTEQLQQPLLLFFAVSHGTARGRDFGAFLLLLLYGELNLDLRVDSFLRESFEKNSKTGTISALLKGDIDRV